MFVVADNEVLQLDHICCIWLGASSLPIKVQP